MNITLFGAHGTLGRRIAQEALSRGHHVTAIARDPAKVDLAHENLTVTPGNVLDAASVAAVTANTDAVVSAVGPGPAGNVQMVVGAAHSLIDGVRRSGAPRLVAVGGAGGLEAAPGLRLVDAPNFPEAWKGIALAQIDAYEVFRASDINWTYVAPSALITPGERTGSYRVSADQLLADAEGQSKISCEDFAVAILDELETPKFERGRFTAGY